MQNDYELDNFQSMHSRFFAKLLEFRTRIYLSHVEQKSFLLSKHEALYSTYVDLGPKIDSLLKGFTGLYNYPNIRIFELGTIPENKLLEYVQDFYRFINESRDALFKDHSLIRIIDEISGIVCDLIYRLKYTK